MSFWDFIFMTKPTKIYSRIEKLWSYTRYFDLNELKNITVLDDSRSTILFEFESHLGKVRIAISNELIEHNQFWLEYANYAGSTVFELRVSKRETFIAPMLGKEINAKDIDLALYELESYLFSNLPDLEETKNKRIVDIHEKQRRHEEQISILE